MSIQVTMPALSPTMTSGTLAKWLVTVGEAVRSGDVIAEIETDKATMEVEAIDDGVVAKIMVEAGAENVAVGAVIAVLAEDGESLDDVAASTTPAATPATKTPAPETPAPETPAPENQANAAVPVVASAQSFGHAAPSADKKRLFATPLARRVAASRGVDLEQVHGSGPHGRILRRDVEAANPSLPAPAGAPLPGSGDASPSPVTRGASTLVANSPMRMAIASRLQQSKQQAPHFYLTVDCRIDQLLSARRALNAKAPEGVKISVNDLVIRAAAMALMAVPDANVAWEGKHTRRFAHADIAMAVAIEGGLVTPVVWAADSMGLAALAQTTADLAGRARDGKLQPADYTGGSFTISNLGMFGIREFAAVINPPQGAILAVGAGEERAIVIDGTLAVATMMTVTLSADHRAVDGAVGARWLQAFKGFIEDPVTMLL
jgi:pyruvate dehydrogenase E2 component (dihydrolipoamide acetyltransferase)